MDRDGRWPEGSASTRCGPALWMAMWTVWGQRGVALWTAGERRLGASVGIERHREGGDQQERRAPPVDTRNFGRKRLRTANRRDWWGLGPAERRRRPRLASPVMDDPLPLRFSSAAPPYGPDVEVRRSARRRRTVSAYRQDGRTIVLVPARMSRAEEARWVTTMVERLARQDRRSRPSDPELLARASDLSRRWLAGRARPAPSAGRQTSGAAGGPAASTRPRSGCRAGCRACRRGSSTTSCSTSSPTWSRPRTARSSGPSWSPFPTARARRAFLDGFWADGHETPRTTRPTPRTSPRGERGSDQPPDAVVRVGQCIDVPPGDVERLRARPRHALRLRPRRPTARRGGRPAPRSTRRRVAVQTHRPGSEQRAAPRCRSPPWPREARRRRRRRSPGSRCPPNCSQRPTLRCRSSRTRRWSALSTSADAVRWSGRPLRRTASGTVARCCEELARSRRWPPLGRAPRPRGGVRRRRSTGRGPAVTRRSAGPAPTCPIRSRPLPPSAKPSGSSRSAGPGKQVGVAPDGVASVDAAVLLEQLPRAGPRPAAAAGAARGRPGSRTSARRAAGRPPAAYGLAQGILRRRAAVDARGHHDVDPALDQGEQRLQPGQGRGLRAGVSSGSKTPDSQGLLEGRRVAGVEAAEQLLEPCCRRR